MCLKGKDTERRMIEPDKILAMQCLSTQKAMARTDSERIEYQLSPIPKSAQCLDENGDAFVNHRPLTFQEVTVETRLRVMRGLHLSVMRNEAQLPINEIKKENAVNAFMNKLSLDKIKERFQAIMSTIKEEVPVLGFKWKNKEQS